MKVRGQRFFYMDTHEKAKFGIKDIHQVIVQQADIEVVDVETMLPVSSQELFLVIVTLEDGKFVSTKPIYDQDYAAYIATTLADKCKQYHDSK